VLSIAWDAIGDARVWAQTLGGDPSKLQWELNKAMEHCGGMLR